MEDINMKDYNYIWEKWLKVYKSGNFSEIDEESLDTLLKAKGFLHLNSVHTDSWEAFGKYIDERKSKKSKKWWHDPLFVGIAGAIVGAIIGALITILISKI